MDGEGIGLELRRLSENLSNFLHWTRSTAWPGAKDTASATLDFASRNTLAL
eukprot:GSA120T00012946001.1